MGTEATTESSKGLGWQMLSGSPGSDVVHGDAAGIDIGRREHYVAVGPDRASQPVRVLERFTADLHRLAEWLKECRIPGMGVGLMLVIGLASSALVPSASADLMIDPMFDSSITTGNANAAAIEGAINAAVGTIDALYSNSVTIPVLFKYTPGAGNDLLSTTQYLYPESYSTYVSMLQTDSTANPGNTVLATALANLAQGNDENGAKGILLSGAQLAMLGGYDYLGSAMPVININSNMNFAFSDPVPSDEYDLIGGLEHELDEVMGAGGAGSNLNYIAANNCPTANYCSFVGPLDLYRYSVGPTPSFTTQSTASSYFSVDGGVTEIVAFNQNSAGDMGDFAPPGTGAGQLIQDAFNSTGQDEAYTSSSPEFEMEEAIGWDATPEPNTLILLGTGLAFLALIANKRKLA